MGHLRATHGIAFLLRSSASLKWILLLLTLLIGGSMTTSFAAPEKARIVLQSGAALEGWILQDREDRIVVDLGRTLLTLEREDIAAIEDPGEESVRDVETGDLFRWLGEGRERSVQENVSRIAEAIVLIRTPTGLGSGFVIHPDGYIVTNEHVISGEQDITVTVYVDRGGDLENLNFRGTRIIAANPFADLALLKIDAERTFVTVPLGDSEALRPGEVVYAIGSPLGLERTVSQGIVSLRNRAFEGRTYIQTTAQINPGNSGGPLLNLRGEVIGVNNMKVAGAGVEGLGFAIPSASLVHFLRNRDAFAFDARNPNAGFRYLSPPGTGSTSPSNLTTDERETDQ